MQSLGHILLECSMSVSLCNEMWKNIEQNIKDMCLDFNALILELLISSYITDFMIQNCLVSSRQWKLRYREKEEGAQHSLIASRDDP